MKRRLAKVIVKNKVSRFLWFSVYIHFRALLRSDGILPGAEITLHPSLAFSYIGSVTARLSSSEHQPNIAVWYKEWNCRTFAEGTTYIWLGSHHVGHRPTFWFVTILSHIVAENQLRCCCGSR